MIYVLYGIFLLMIGVSLRRPVGALAEARRQQANLRRELAALAAAPIAAAASFDHLSPGLARLAEETRVLRLVLEEPLQAARAWLASDRSPWLARLDVGDGSDLDRVEEVDVSLVNARRALWDWMAAVEGLAEDDRETLAQLGLSVGVVRGALEQRDAFRRRSAVARRETPRIERMIAPVQVALDRFEAELVRATRTGLYR